MAVLITGADEYPSTYATARTVRVGVRVSSHAVWSIRNQRIMRSPSGKCASRNSVLRVARSACFASTPPLVIQARPWAGTAAERPRWTPDRFAPPTPRTVMRIVRRALMRAAILTAVGLVQAASAQSPEYHLVGRIVTDTGAIGFPAIADAFAFDSCSGLLLHPNGNGTMSVIHEDTPDTSRDCGWL
jgi:hypothetical protein